jgi:spermidine synthase
VREDRTGIVLLRLDDAGRGRMYIQGHSQSCLPFCTVHALLGAIGPLTHPNPETVLVIGSGTGGTPYAAAADPRTREVRIIEIVEPVVGSLKQFVGEGGRYGAEQIVAPGRFSLRIGDGRHALAIDRSRYDVIEADAILPKSSLSGLLYSAEFFEAVRARLAPGGIYVQWVPTARTVETFRQVFPYVTMVHPALLGSDRPIDYDVNNLLARFDSSAVQSHFAAAQIDIAELRRWFVEKRPQVLNSGRTVPGKEINTDLFPRDEYYLNR